MPDIIFSNSSHHGTWLSFFACSISCVFFSLAAIFVSAHYLDMMETVETQNTGLLFGFWILDFIYICM